MREQLVPEVQRKIFVDAAEARNKVVFERAHGTFDSVAAMKTWGNKLEVDGGVAQKGFERFGTLVVQSVELGSQSGREQPLVDDLESRQDAWPRSAAHWLHQNAVAVVIIHDQHVIVSRAGCDHKFTGLIRMNLSGGGFEDGGETSVRSSVVGLTGGKHFVENCCGVVGQKARFG